MINENTYLLPSVESYDLSRGENDPTEGTNILFVGISARNQPGWAELSKES